jgi:2-dehydro-3-deoxyphosphogalactonate aldolase
VLPKETVVGAVGGVSDKNLAAYVTAGVRAFGLGSSLYRPGMTAAAVRDTAQASVRAYDQALIEAASAARM